MRLWAVLRSTGVQSRGLLQSGRESAAVFLELGGGAVADAGLVGPYAVVRITEGFIYNDAIVAVEPEVERAASIVALLLEP